MVTIQHPKMIKVPSKEMRGFLITHVLTFFLFFTVVHCGLAQTVTGTVTAADGQPLPAVNVLQKGTSNGVVADFDGNYTITLDEGSDVLVFSYIGFISVEETVGNRTTINIIMQEDTQNLDEVVVIGYAAIEREKVTGALSTVKSEDIQKITPINAFDAVQGRLSGVQIATNGGPGAGFDIRIRGTSTFSGGTEPLYVVDGQQLLNIDNLDPNDIASLEVLKDGATAAIYGSRAANGVVLITTKSGQSGDLTVDVNVNSSISSLIGGLPLANTRQRVFYEDVRRGNTTNLTGTQRDSLNLLTRNSFDLQDLITRSAFRNQVNVGIGGGGEKSTFYWNNGFLSEEGVVVNSDYKRLSSRFKLDLRPSSKLQIGTNLNLSFEEQSGLNENQVFQQLVSRIPYFPVFEPNGTFTPEIAGRQNPIAEANERTIINTNYRAQLFNYIEYKLLPTLSIKSTLGLNFRYRKNTSFSPIITQNPRSPIPRGARFDQLTYDVQQENFINYRESFGNHNLSAFGGMQLQKYWFEGFDVDALFVSDAIETYNNIDPTSFAINVNNNPARPQNTEDSNNNLFSLFAGFNYDYNNTYLLGATIRRDGSSRFGPENKYGTFSSLTGGWRISNEGFMEGARDIVSNLLLRASYGETGNQNIGNYEYIGAYSPGAIYNGLSGVSPTRLGNPNLRWESTAASNIGVDLGMFNNRLNLMVDVWEKTTTDVLANIPLPEETGFGSIRQNVGTVENRGLDIELNGTVIQTSNFEWFSSFNIGFLENEVTQLNDDVPFQSGQFLIEEGQPLGNIFGFKNLGVYQYDESNAYTDDGVRLTPNFDANGDFTNYTLNGSEFTGNVNQLRNAGRVLEGGDIIWDDTNTDFDITEADRQIIGNGLPEFFGGFSNDFRYKNFGISLLFDFNFGNDIYRRYDEDRNDLNAANETPGPDRIEGAWLEPGDITVYPRLNRVPQNRERPNSFFVTEGDFIKLRFVRFNYDMPKTILDKMEWIKNLSFNLSFNNFFTWTNYIGYNPELGSRGNPLQPGVDNLRYPNEREVILGLRVQL